MPPMKKMVAAANPDAYVAALRGWRKELVAELRDAVRGAARGALDEQIKWGHLVYLSEGPVLLVRAEDERVLLGFWRGKRLRDIEPRLVPGGKYEMATVELKKGDRIAPATVRKLATEAMRLNNKLGNPTAAARVAKS